MVDFKEALAETKEQARHLLLGNGFSIACHPQFNYTHLLRVADLSPSLKKVFENAKTFSFEGAMRTLNNIVYSLKALNAISDYGVVDEQVIENIEKEEKSLKTKLIKTLQAIHPIKSNSIEMAKYLSCRKFLKNFIQGQESKIFSLNYDLLLYWALMKKKDDAFGYMGRDGFLKDEKSGLSWNQKNPQNIHYLHGALHLFEKDTFLSKLEYKEKKPILDEIQEKFSKESYPLFICEGRSHEKLKAIQENAYLLHALTQLKHIQGPLYIVGCSLGKEDKHIWKAVAQNTRIDHLYISIHESDKKQVITRARDKFENKALHFFNIEDANIWKTETHLL